MRVLVLLMLSLSLFAEDRITTHLLQLESGPLSYTATVGSLPMKNEKGEESGGMHYISYVREGARRPLTFVFNGGPGSSSVWLHLGSFGPRRILTPEEGQSVAPPYAIQDNPETILDLTDIVFVDPIGTGLSRANSDEEAKACYDSFGDVHSIGNFIRDYLTANKRWNSPLYLAGESYGTFRCCGLADYLQGELGIYLNGLILISCAIDFQGFIFDSDNLLPYQLFLPTYAATAWYHGRLGTDKTVEEIAEEAREFAFGTYATALLRPSRANADELYRKVSEMTTLPLDAVKRASGRIDDDLFFLQFFPGEKKVIGRFDTRMTGYYTNPALTNFAQDPSATSVDGIFSTAIHSYLADELDSPVSYTILSTDVNRQWKYRSYNYFGYPNFLEALRKSLVANPALKVYVGMGYFDAATPFAAAEYCLEHLNLPRSFDQNIQKGYYEGGHMYYLNPKERIRFKNDLTQFYGK